MSDPFVTIDLHGLIREEAMHRIDTTLRDAGSGVYQVRLVHGYHKGIPVDRVDDPSGEYAVPMTLIVDGDTVFADSCDLEYFDNYREGDTPLSWFQHHLELMDSDPSLIPPYPLVGTSKYSHHRRAAEFQPSSTCKNLDCPPGSLRLLQVKSD